MNAPIRSRGITLVELMTVVVVVGILATIAVPSYRSYIIRTHRTDATGMLLRIQAAQERFHLQRHRYSHDLDAAHADDGLAIPLISEGGKYDLDVGPRPGGGFQSYVATATPRAGGGQEDDPLCQVFTIDEQGTKTADDGGGTDRTADCWR